MVYPAVPPRHPPCVAARGGNVVVNNKNKSIGNGFPVKVILVIGCPIKHICLWRTNNFEAQPLARPGSARFFEEPATGQSRPEFIVPPGEEVVIYFLSLLGPLFGR